MVSKDKNNSAIVASTLGQAAAYFIITLPPESRPKAQQEIYKFVRWYGEERQFIEFTIPEVANYSDQITSSTTEIEEKLAIVKTFLSYCAKQKWTKTNLAVHLKVKKTHPVPRFRSRRIQHKEIILTEHGRADVEAELTALKNERPRMAEEIQKAAADKDFRENAPLEAAREHQGHVEARIRELEATLKTATDMSEKQVGDHYISIGDTVMLCELASGEEIRYSLVDTREANPAEGKISVESPVGQTILGHSKGDVVKIKVPAGAITYEIKDIVHK
jgi:transcription elongation factor GreA